MNFFYILFIVISYLLVPYHNIRTGMTNWVFTGLLGTRGPVNAAALAVQRTLTFALIIFYIYNLRLKRRMRDENFEIDLAIKESEDRRHLVEREFFKLKRQVKEKLGSSEQYFYNLFDNLPVACFGYDQEGKIITWNKAASKLYGFRKEDVLGRSMFETIAQKKDYKQGMFYISEVFKGRSFDGLEWEDKNADGAVRYVYTSTYPLCNLEGKVSLGISANVDITAQKTIEHELKDSKEHLEKIMNTPQNLIVELDRDMRIKMFNKGCEEITGYSRNEVIGKNWIELFVPDRLKDTVKFVIEEAKSDRNILPSHYESPILTKAAEERVIFWSNTNLKDENGELISVIAIGGDITVRKRAQQKIIDSEQKYRTFLENVPIHVGVIDESGKYIIWNKYSEEMLGYTKQEVLGKMSPKDIHETEEEAREVIELATGEGIFDRELNLIHKDGRRIAARLVVVPRVIDDKIVGYCGFAEDISRRRTTEKELLAAKVRLESIALKDPLTELYNNRYVVERLASEFERAKRSFSSLSLLLIDLDYFKSINDKYGHEFGDKVLIQTAKLLRSELRVNDVVARWGGEEFMIILPEIDRKNAIIVSKKIIRAFEKKGFGDEKNIVNLKCSIGIVSYPEDPLFSPKEMFESVEKSVFKVKTAGGNGVGSYIRGFVKDDDREEISDKDRLLKALKEKMSFFAIKGEDSILEAIYSLSKSLELKDHPTRAHSEKTVHHAVKLAQKFGLSEKDIEDVRRAAILHDIGKLGIPDKILLKKGPLTKREFEVVKQHPKIAVEIISAAEFLKDSIPYVLHHHEWFDGGGYPDGLKGENIPFGARIISIVDVYEALTADRPYRKALTKKEAIKLIKNNSGTQFDPKLVDAFIGLISSENNS